MNISDQPRQRIFRDIGEGACYFLSIIRAAEAVTAEYIDAFVAFVAALSTPVVIGQTYVPMVRSDGFINGAGELLSTLTGEKYTMTKEDADYKCKLDEVEVLRYEWTETKIGESKVHGHFVLGDGTGRVFFDPFGESQTVKNGKLVSKRIFRKV